MRGGLSRPILARNETFSTPSSFVSHEYLTLSFVRTGSALLLGRFGEMQLDVGDVVLIDANTICKVKPERRTTVTTLCVYRDFVVDQVYWQYAGIFVNRLNAKDFVDRVRSQPARILHLGKDEFKSLMPLLDELVSCCAAGPDPKRFYRLQSLLFTVLDAAPFFRIKPGPGRRKQRSRRPRSEAYHTAQLLRTRPQIPWTLSSLAERVNLSPKQLARVFTEAYGKTPLAYLTTVRVETMAQLLRETG